MAAAGPEGQRVARRLRRRHGPATRRRDVASVAWGSGAAAIPGPGGGPGPVIAVGIAPRRDSPVTPCRDGEKRPPALAPFTGLYIMRVSLYVMRVSLYIMRVSLYIMRVSLYIMRVSLYITRVSLCVFHLCVHYACAPRPLWPCGRRRRNPALKSGQRGFDPSYPRRTKRAILVNDSEMRRAYSLLRPPPPPLTRASAPAPPTPELSLGSRRPKRADSESTRPSSTRNQLGCVSRQ